jgi:hypothetical protein
LLAKKLIVEHVVLWELKISVFLALVDLCWFSLLDPDNLDYEGGIGFQEGTSEDATIKDKSPDS